MSWTYIGAGVQSNGGWELVRRSLPPEAVLRARGRVAGGNRNSGWFVETRLDLTTSIRLNVVRDGSSIVLSWSKAQGPYQVQQTTDLTQPSLWQDLGSPVLTNSLSLRIGSDTRFLRVQGK